jgi:hypothetical protein
VVDFRQLTELDVAGLETFAEHWALVHQKLDSAPASSNVLNDSFRSSEVLNESFKTSGPDWRVRPGSASA